MSEQENESKLGTPKASTQPSRQPLNPALKRALIGFGVLVAWAKNLHDLFLEMLERVQALKARDAPSTEKEFRRWQQRYRKILRAGRRANPTTPQQMAMKRLKQSKAQNLLDRLEGYDDCILAFLWDSDLPFTNNEAERAFRMMKVRIKISGCFRNA